MSRCHGRKSVLLKESVESRDLLGSGSILSMLDGIRIKEECGPQYIYEIIEIPPHV